MNDQPHRDHAIGVIAAALAEDEPTLSVLDIGANVGDTAAIVATYAPAAQLILVEPSDVFFPILEKNASNFANLRRLEKAVVGVEGPGRFRHWGGTAVFEPGGEELRAPRTMTLDELADSDTRMLKIDTDGWDYQILMNGRSWLREQRVLVFYEVECTSSELLQDANNSLDALLEAGYTRFVVWDDPGFLVVSTHDHETLRSLFRYLFVSRCTPGVALRIANFDVLAAKPEDEDVVELVVQRWLERERRYTARA